MTPNIAVDLETILGSVKIYYDKESITINTLLELFYLSKDRCLCHLM